MKIKTPNANWKIDLFNSKTHLKSKRLLKMKFTTLIFVLISLTAYSQNTDFCHQATMIVKTAEKYHYSPRDIDDKFSELLFAEFFNLLDPNGFYLTQSEITQLETYRLELDDEIKVENCTFLKVINELYKKKLLLSDSLITKLKTKKINYSTSDTLVLKRDDICLTQKELTNKWEKFIRFQVISSYYANIDSTQKDKKPTPTELIEIQNKVLTNEACKIKSRINYLGGTEAFVGSVFLKAIATTFDPHTNYFTQSEEQEFIGELSKEVSSFGINISRNDVGEIEISELLPGSSAWSSNLLNEGDVILKLKAGGLEKEFNCIAMSEVMMIFNNQNIIEAEFLIRKKSGKEVTVVLNKSKIDVVDNVIKSFVLEKDQKIGYIYLPSFYSQMDNNNYMHNGCAGDVAKELIKLKNENINGLILDLRNNGGGSMMEAILMTGIFVDYGAVSIVKKRDIEAATLKDLNRGTIYNAPIVILINNFSASASELFAAAMQDQNRAIIVGSKSFGKSTMQTIVPIDAYKYSSTDSYTGVAPGYLKLTTGAFFRVTGKSHQKMGVTPDIKLPSIYEGIKMSESSYPTALNSNTIDKKIYYYPQPALPTLKLNELSEARTKNSPLFSNIKEQSKTVSNDYYKISIPLDPNSFQKFIDSKDENKLPNRDPNFTIRNPSYLKGISSLTNPNQEINEENMMLIKEDIYIEEAFNIINDLIILNKK